jgi:biotin operon repressor
MKPLKRVVIKEELVELTGDFRPALILNQFIYWIERMYDTDKYILEEKERALKHEMEVSIDESKGWVYKTAEELNEELMIGMSVPTIRKYIKQLVEKGYLIQRRNPKYKWDKTMQYRVDLYKVQLDLGKMGYVLEGFKLLPNIKIVEEIEPAEETEDVIEDIKENENKKTPTFAEVEADENKNLIDDNIIPQEEENYASNSEEIKEEDVKEIAYKLCLEENPNFDSLEEWRKDFFIGVKISKLLKGDM